MRLEELRIGNFINAFGVCKIICIDSDKNSIKIQRETKNDDVYRCEWMPIKSFSIEPFSLTEEWLIKFGIKNDDKFIDFFENHTRLSLWRDPKTFNGFIADWADKTIGEVKYVHQLQNLYFDLTGEELTTKAS